MSETKTRALQIAKGKDAGSLESILKSLSGAVDLGPAEARRFFKTGEGEYAHGDQFLGIRMPTLRVLAKLYQDISLDLIKELLAQPYNEARMLALLILVYQYQKGSEAHKQAVFDCYLKNLEAVNNWNLVDASAHLIVGVHLLDKEKDMLLGLANGALWERRVAVVATWAFIRHRQFDWTCRLSEHLLRDPEDLMHKACGWMLREMGKRDESVLCGFLSKHAAVMPRTMLRYAVERLPEKARRQYMEVKKSPAS